MKRNLRTAFIATSLFIGALGFSSQTSAQAQPAPAAPSPQVPASIQPDDLSELQNCYNALHDPQMCQLLVAEQAKWDVRFFELKYANPNSVYQALGIFRARVNVSQNLRLISVKAPKEIMPAIEDAIKRLDVPPAPRKSVELTLFIVSASDPAASAGGPTAGGSIPPALQGVVNQLKNVFAYKQYQLVDTLILTGVDGQPLNTNGILPTNAFARLAQPVPTYYDFKAPLALQMPDQRNPILRMDQFRFTLKVPIPSGPASSSAGSTNYSVVDVGINTVVEIAAGQQVVVGKATVGDSALILVLSAKIL